MFKIFDKKGFTLVELLMALAIVGVIAGFTLGIASSVRNMGKTGETERRMKIIVEKTVNFYRTKQEIPRPFDSTGNPEPVPAIIPATVSGIVPITPEYLNLEQKYRFDGWGKFFVYVMALEGTVTINGIDIPPTGTGYHTDANTDIDGIDYNGQRVAGLIISHGPNQVFDYTLSTAVPAVFSLNTGGDDIIIPINVSQVAAEIALEELKILQDKVKAFDALYLGFNNDGDNATDEDKLHEQCVYPGTDNDDCTSWTDVCPPDFDTNQNDPNNGLTTLDAIDNGKYSGCECEADDSWNWDTIGVATPGSPAINDTVNAMIYCLYQLADTVMVDPWLNVYVWGSEGDLNNDNQDDRYHKFYSWGPDLDTDFNDQTGTLDDDDIIP